MPRGKTVGVGFEHLANALQCVALLANIYVHEGYLYRRSSGVKPVVQLVKHRLATTLSVRGTVTTSHTTNRAPLVVVSDRVASVSKSVDQMCCRMLHLGVERAHPQSRSLVDDLRALQIVK